MDELNGDPNASPRFRRLIFEVEVDISDEAHSVRQATDFLTVRLEDGRVIPPAVQGLDRVLLAVTDVLNNALAEHADQTGASAFAPGQSQWRLMDMYGAYPAAAIPAQPGRRADGSYTDDS